MADDFISKVILCLTSICVLFFLHGICNSVVGKLPAQLKLKIVHERDNF